MGVGVGEGVLGVQYRECMFHTRSLTPVYMVDVAICEEVLEHSRAEWRGSSKAHPAQPWNAVLARQNTCQTRTCTFPDRPLPCLTLSQQNQHYVNFCACVGSC